MSDDLVKVTVSEGKYTFGQRKDGSCYALRYGEPWREDIFDGLTLAMAHHIEVLEAAFSNLSREYDKRADRIEELEGQLQSVLDRETSILRYYDAKLDAADAKLDAVEAKESDVVSKTLDAANEHITTRYGISALGNPIDRSLIIANIKGEQP